MPTMVWLLYDILLGQRPFIQRFKLYIISLGLHAVDDRTLLIQWKCTEQGML